MKRSARLKTKKTSNSNILRMSYQEEQSPQSSRSSAESTACMFSGKKRKRSDSKSAPKQRYLKTSTNSQLDFNNYGYKERPKTKKQYWTEEEDQKLRVFVEKFGAKSWKKIAQYFERYF